MISSRKFTFWTNSRHLDFTFAWYTMLINRKHRSGGESGWLDPRNGAVTSPADAGWAADAGGTRPDDIESSWHGASFFFPLIEAVRSRADGLFLRENEKTLDNLWEKVYNESGNYLLPSMVTCEAQYPSVRTYEVYKGVGSIVAVKNVKKLQFVNG